MSSIHFSNSDRAIETGERAVVPVHAATPLSRPRTRYVGFYTISEAAEYLRVSERTVRNLLRRGTLRRVGPFRPYRIAAQDVEKLITPPC
jgi:excisionase family DNA binding protein